MDRAFRPCCAIDARSISKSPRHGTRAVGVHLPQDQRTVDEPTDKAALREALAEVRAPCWNRPNVR